MIWNIIFPIAYLTLFSLALSKVVTTSDVDLDTVRIVMPSYEANEDFREFLDGVDGQEISVDKLSETNDVFLEYVLVDSAEKAEELVSDKKVHAFVEFEPELQFTGTGEPSVYPSIVKQLLDSYKGMKKSEESIQNAVMDGTISNPENLMALEKGFDPPKLDLSKRYESVSPDKIYFFVSFAYLAFFPLAAGAQVVENTEANQNVYTMRKRLGPASKLKVFFSSLVPLLVFQLLLISLIYVYSKFLGVDYGEHHLGNLSLGWLGTIASMFTGAALATYTPKNKNFRQALMIGVPLLIAFLGGMMVQNIYTMMQEKFPIINKISPIGMISDGLYILNAEGYSARFFQKLSALSIYLLIFVVLTLVGLRRKKYESI